MTNDEPVIAHPYPYNEHMRNKASADSQVCRVAEDTTCAVAYDECHEHQPLDENAWEAFLQSDASDSLFCHAPNISEATSETGPLPKRSARAANAKDRAVQALRTMVELDPSLIEAKADEKRAWQWLCAEAGNGSKKRKISEAREAWQHATKVVDDFHLAHVSAIADSMERCGSGSHPACHSYWCPHCRKRYGARLLEDTLAQLKERHGEDLERAREHLLYNTILNELVIPDPDVLADGERGNFFAGVLRRDHLDVGRFLKRWQDSNSSLAHRILEKHKLNMRLIEDRIHLAERDHRFYRHEIFLDDAIRLVEMNIDIRTANSRFKGKNRCVPNLETTELVSCRDEQRQDAYLYQLRKATPLNRLEIFQLARCLQSVFRDFSNITKTRFKERLKFKSSIEKVMKRERKKLYRLSKDLPGLSLIGQFELELIDLKFAVGGTHQHTIKSATLRSLASQDRKGGTKQGVPFSSSPNASVRRRKHAHRERLLDEARRRIANNEPIPESEFPGLRYAVVVHMHVLIDLNGHSRDDVERWFTGKDRGDRRFQGQWKLPHQVMIKSLFTGRSVLQNLKSISFYPFKDVTSFNYRNEAPERNADVSDGVDTANFPDDALAIICWLQRGIGHESLRLQINWPGLTQKRRGRKARAQAGMLTKEDFDPLFDRLLSERGLSCPAEPHDQTIGQKFNVEMAELMALFGSNDTTVSEPTPVTAHAAKQSSVES